MALRVLHVITGLNDGGAEAVLYRLCTHDRMHIHAVVSMMDQGKYGPLLEEAGVEVHCLGMPRGNLTIRGMIKLGRILHRWRPDVVQTWMYHANLIGGIVARLSGIRTISWGIHHTNLVPEVSPWSTILVARISALLSHLVPASIVCCSQRSIEVHRGIGYRADKLIYIPNGYDISRFKPDSWERNRIRLELGIQGPIPLLGMVARHDPQKDHDNLIKALGILKRSRVVFRCALIGTGMDGTNQSLREAIDREGLFEDIILLGRRDDIPRIMNGLDLHILSSSGESFPNVLAEAMACGTPCVTTNVGDAAIIIGETGWLVPPSDPAALAGAIEMAIKERSQDPSGWQKRCAAARDRIASNFEIGLMVAMYRDCWRAIKGRS